MGQALGFHSTLTHAQFCNLSILQCGGYDLLCYPASTGSPLVNALLDDHSWKPSMAAPLLEQTEHRHLIASAEMSPEDHSFAHRCGRVPLQLDP